jgi:DNA-binding transcriptional MerR regulator
LSNPRIPERPVDKSPDAFRTISEVAEDLDLPQHVLRFWETRFTQIRPLKRGGGRRYYRPDDVDLLKGIRHLLYGEGYTIKGVQRILKEEGPRFVQSVGRGEQQVAAPPEGRASPADAYGEANLFEADATGAFPALESSRAGTDRDSSSPSLSADDLERLRAVLQDLSECDRVLRNLHSPEPLPVE